MKSVTKKYVIATYLTFWFMVLFLCGGASMVFHASPVVMRVLSNVCAWSPTLVLLLGFSVWKPGVKRIEYIKSLFTGKIKVSLLLIPAIAVLLCSIVTVFIVSLLQQKTFFSYVEMGSYPFIISILFSITSGPTGEEAGWRGFLREKLNERYTFLKGAVIQGVIWAFWHTVLWFVDSEFMGWSMIPYVLSNVVVMTCLAIIMNVVLEKEHNLLYSILIHFAFNIVYCFLQVDIVFYIVLMVTYVLLACGALLYRKTCEKYTKKGN